MKIKIHFIAIVAIILFAVGTSIYGSGEIERKNIPVAVRIDGDSIPAGTSVILKGVGGLPTGGDSSVDSRRGGIGWSSTRGGPPPSGGFRISGARSPQSVHLSIRQNMEILRRAYNVQLRSNPDMSGTIVITFAINESGAVTSATMDSSTVGNEEFEQVILDRVLNSFKFEPIDIQGDITTVTFPFGFSR